MWELTLGEKSAGKAQPFIAFARIPAASNLTSTEELKTKDKMTKDAFPKTKTSGWFLHLCTGLKVGEMVQMVHCLWTLYTTRTGTIMLRLMHQVSYIIHHTSSYSTEKAGE